MITEKIDNITKVRQYEKVLSAPKSVKIELTPKCNLRCSFCSLRTREDQPTQSMSWDLFKAITSEMRKEGVEEIGLFYLGESFTDPNLLKQAVWWTKKVCGFPYVFLTTNGTLANPDIVERLMRDGLDSLKWSINAADQKQYEEVTGTARRWFDVSLENLKRARELRDNLRLNTKIYASSIRYDGEQLQRMESMLQERVLPYVDEHYWLPLYGMAMTAERMKQDTGWTATIGNMGRYDEAIGTGNRHDQGVCWAAFTEGHVRADGHLSACCFGATDKFDVGDLTTQGFMEAWNSPAYQEIRQAQLDLMNGDKNALKGTMCEVCIAYEA